ncbi:MAG: LysM peptidoglycan-binding domain-containing protein [Clostridiales bacterium]|nr:LysM peptidoglycan-binding domain-containing protein [Clostridiales bacterium]
MFCLFYEVKQGDTLYSISRSYNVELNAIIRANPFINVYNLQIGDVLCLPCVPQNKYAHFTTYLIEEGDTLGSVVEKHEINLADLLEINDIYSISLMPGSTLSVPIVGEGESGLSL